MAGIAALDRELLDLIFSAVHRDDRFAASLAYREFNRLRPHNDRFETDVLAMNQTSVLLVLAASLHVNKYPQLQCAVELDHTDRYTRLRGLQSLARPDPLGSMLVAVHAGAIVQTLADQSPVTAPAAECILDKLFHLVLFCCVSLLEVRTMAATGIAEMLGHLRVAVR